MICLTDNLAECCRTRRHQDLSDTIIEVLDALVRNPKECLGGSLLGRLLGKVPDTILERVLLSLLRPDPWQDTDFKAAHGEEQLWVVLGVDGAESVVPFDRG